MYVNVANYNFNMCLNISGYIISLLSGKTIQRTYFEMGQSNSYKDT